MAWRRAISVGLIGLRGPLRGNSSRNFRHLVYRTPKCGPGSNASDPRFSFLTPLDDIPAAAMPGQSPNKINIVKGTADVGNG